MTDPHANSVVSDAVADYRGTVMFHCGVCGAPLTKEDFFDMSLRLPDVGESKDAYCEAELIDRMSHTACLRAARAG